MNHIRPAIVLTLIFVVLTGLAFPVLVTGVAQVAFPKQANGSLVTGPAGAVIGSELIGQNFTDPAYFHPRPSAAGAGYDAANSGGTNLGPTNPKLLEGASDGSFLGVKQLAEAYRKENGLASNEAVPVDAVTRSASGLDPHISVRNAELQASRVAKARGMSLEAVMAKIKDCTEGPFAVIFGDPGVNVLKLNLALEAAKKVGDSSTRS